MAKSVRSFNLVQGKKVIPVSVKTTTEEFFRKLIRDYQRRGELSVFEEVKVVPVIPQFG